jgi:DNA-binding IclR family transcriptional regulator
VCLLSAEPEDIRSIRHGLALLRRLSTVEPLRVAVIARELGVTRQAAYRLVGTLAALGYVSVTRIGAASVVTPSIYVRRLSGGFGIESDIAASGLPLMRTWTEAHGLPLELSIPNDVYMFAHSTTDFTASRVRTRRAPGAQQPMVSTAAGIVYVALQPRFVQASLLREMRANPDRRFDLARDSRNLKRTLRNARAQRRAILALEAERESVLAVPVEFGGQVVACLSVRFMKVSGELRRVDTWAERVGELASQISRSSLPGASRSLSG